MPKEVLLFPWKSFSLLFLTIHIWKIKNFRILKWPWPWTIMSFPSAKIGASIPNGPMSPWWIVQKLFVFSLKLRKFQGQYMLEVASGPFDMNRLKEPPSWLKTSVKVSKWVQGSSDNILFIHEWAITSNKFWKLSGKGSIDPMTLVTNYKKQNLVQCF